jgi:hypothetical protein
MKKKNLIIKMYQYADEITMKSTDLNHLFIRQTEKIHNTKKKTNDKQENSTHNYSIIEMFALMMLDVTIRFFVKKQSGWHIGHLSSSK